VKLAAIIMLFSQLSFAACMKLPEIVYKSLERQSPGLGMARKSSEVACQAAGMCASRMQLREDNGAFVVECVSEAEWEVIAKDVISKLPPEL